MKQLKIFDRVHKYSLNFEVKSDIEIIKRLKEEIRKPQILSYYGLETVHFNIGGGDDSIGSDCMQWIYEQNKDRLNEKYIRECLLKCSTEDEKWTEWRNSNLTGVFYRKITFLPEIQDTVCKALDEYLNDLSVILTELTKEGMEQEEDIERQKEEWNVTNVYKDVHPSGGEGGIDGYFDAEYTSKNGDVVRMVNRDVFDVGVFFYPKRLEGTDDVLKRSLWTEPEKQLATWLNKFGKFKKTRI